MVWGMQEPGSFGDYFLDGDYVGWKESIQQYFDQEMSEVERAKFDNAHGHYRYEIAQKFAYEADRMQAHEWPREFCAEKTYNNLGSLIKLTDRLLAVDGALKEIIERLEPGVHQFSPITITMPKGKVYPKQYHAFVISQFLDSFSPEESDDDSWKIGGLKKDKFRVKRPQKKYINGLAMRSSLNKEAHLWREKKLRSPDFFLSDTLHDEIARRELRVPKMYKLKEV